MLRLADKLGASGCDRADVAPVAKPTSPPDVLDLLRSRNVALALTEGRWIKRAVVLDQALEPTANFGSMTRQRLKSPIAPSRSPDLRRRLPRSL